MSDDKVFTITKERILAGAKGCPTAREALRSMFPEAFEKKEEWIEMPLANFHIAAPWENEPYSLFALADGGRVPFSIYRAIVPDFKNEYERDYKYVEGKLWRRK